MAGVFCFDLESSSQLIKMHYDTEYKLVTYHICNSEQ
jgi:hypothetical protein